MPYLAEGTLPATTQLREKALLSLGELPAFTPILSKLLATLGGEDVSTNTLGDIIEKDAVVAGNVLHLVNSALYSRRNPIISVRHAISFLGMNKLRNAVLGMSVARLWKSVTMPASWSRSRFNTHSAATAIMCDLLAQHVDVEDAETAFVAGLLHDIGHLLIAWSLPKQYAEIQSLNATGLAWVECEKEILGFTHAELSSEALVVWRLPLSIVTAVRGHHTDVPGNGPLCMGQVIAAADQFVKAAGMTIRDEYPLPPAPKAADEGGDEGKQRLLPFLQLGLEEKLAAALATDFQTECNATLQFFN